MKFNSVSMDEFEAGDDVLEVWRGGCCSVPDDQSESFEEKRRSEHDDRLPLLDRASASVAPQAWR